MLTYRTGSAGTGQTARNMAEHLLQQTLPPEMAIMAEYYEQGVTPPTAAEAAAGRFARMTLDGQLPAGAELDTLVDIETARLAASAVGDGGKAIAADELRIRALAAFVGAGMLDKREAIASVGRFGSAVDSESLDQAISLAITARDRSSATATPRRDMNPGLAARLGITPHRGLRQDEIAFLLNGQRADGQRIEGKRQKASAPPVSEIFGLNAELRPSRDQLARILAGQTTDGVDLPEKEAIRAVRRFTAALGAKSKEITPVERENILSGRMADGSEVTDREYRAVLEQGSSRIGYIDLTFSAPKSFSVAWAFAPTNAERAMLHQAHTDAIESVLLVVEKEIGRARKGDGGKDGYEPGAIGWVTFDHYAARPTVEVVRADAQGRPTTELHTLAGSGGRVPGDMQVHTHVAVFNAVETASGHVGGLDLAQLDGRIHVSNRVQP